MSRFVLVVLLLCGCYQPPSPGPGPSPVPPSNAIEAAAERNMRSNPEAMASLYDQFAEELRAGKYKTAREFANEVERRAEQTRVNNFSQFRESWGSSANWDPLVDAEKCSRSAAGFRRAAK